MRYAWKLYQIVPAFVGHSLQLPTVPTHRSDEFKTTYELDRINWIKAKPDTSWFSRSSRDCSRAPATWNSRDLKSNDEATFLSYFLPSRLASSYLQFHVHSIANHSVLLTIKPSWHISLSVKSKFLLGTDFTKLLYLAASCALIQHLHEMKSSNIIWSIHSWPWRRPW